MAKRSKLINHAVYMCGVDNLLVIFLYSANKDKKRFFRVYIHIPTTYLCNQDDGDVFELLAAAALACVVMTPGP